MRVNSERWWLYLVGAGFVISGLLALVETGALELGLSLAYFVLLLAGCGLLYLGWLVVRGEGAPRWLYLIALLGLMLRVVVGAVLYKGLPEWGYDEKAQRSGYVYWDAYKRDQDAWARGRSEVPLTAAFTMPKSSDQYGGLLYVSAFIYRYLGGEQHHPLLVVVALASVSMLAVFFTWGFAKRVAGMKTAGLAAWFIVLYPESVLLGASQMREPILIAALALTLYGYIVLRAGETARGLGMLFTALCILTLPVSPPTVLILLAILGGAWLWEARQRKRLISGVMTVGILIAVAAVIVTARSWASLEGIGGSIWDVTRAWLANAGAQWRVNLISSQSDLLDVVLDRLPGAFQVPFLVFFGLLQPFLPASIVAPGASIWKIIGTFRSLGWALSLPLLFFASVRSLHPTRVRSLMPYLVLVFWLAAGIASYRAPSYQWDNPRYRAIFVAIQAFLMAWAWELARETGDRWLKRSFVLVFQPIAVVTLWYFARYSGSFTMSLELAIAASVTLDMVYMLVVFILDRRRHARALQE